MIGEPAGWYRDPAPPNPAAPSTLRFWDGQQWTTQVRPASRREREAWRSERSAQQPAYARSGSPSAPFGTPGGPPAGPPAGVLTTWSRDVTPDGQLLAGWWSRAGAYVIDSILTSVAGVVLGWHFVMRMGQVLSDLADQTQQATAAGSTPPDASSVIGAITGPLVGLVAVLWAVKLVYGVGFLKAFAATPGKFLLGLEVRLRARPGPLPWGTVLARWFAQNVAGLLQLVPLVGLIGSAYSLLDDLWPLWDGGRQALHDKVARTQVVRRG